MTWYPYNPSLGQAIQSDVGGDSEDFAFIGHQVWAAPAAAAEDGIVAGGPVATSAVDPTVVTTGITNPDYARNVVINPAGTTADVAACNITVVGTDLNDEAATEAIAVVENQAHDTLSVGAKAFKTITSITIPAQDGAGATFHIGTGDKLGLKWKRAALPCIAAYLNLTKEGTAPTIASSATVLASNTIDLNSALDGNQVDAFLVV